MNRKISNSIFLTMLAVVFATSCKKYADPPPIFEDNKDTVKTISRRVLVIGIDGFAGAEAKAIAPPKITELQAKSKYAWDAVSDVSTTDAASWKTLTSGVSYTTHQIQDSGFVVWPGEVGSPEHAPIKSVPSIFNLILGSSKSDLRMAIASTWKTLLDRGAPEIERKMLGANDAAVKDSIVNVLKNSNPQLVLTHFNSPAIAGKQAGFTASADAYKNAILQVDGYISEIMTALKARPEYNKSEQWLVVITGTHGGVGNAYGTGNIAEANVFSMYYSEGLKQLEFTKEGAFYTPRIFGKTTDNSYSRAVLGGNDIYNVGAGQQTVQIRVKGGSARYPHFFSKTAGFINNPGWTVLVGDNGWQLSMKSTTSNEARMGGGVAFDNSWHTITFTFADSASKWWARTYTDGIRVNQLDISSFRNNSGVISSTTPVIVGWGAATGSIAEDLYASEISIFNTALTDAEIFNNVCLKDITQHPKYKTNLIGYWPLNEGFGGKFVNKAPITGGGDFNVEGTPTWTVLPDYPCSYGGIISTGTKSTRLMKSVDFASNLFYWLKINTVTSWGLQGNAWLPLYDKEFLK